jgi:hypothetical protein
MNDFGDVVGPIIGLVAAVLSLSIPIVYIVTRSRRLERALELLHQERMAAIERGMELPASSIELLGDQMASAKRPRTALLPGLVWLFVGVAITLSRVSIDDRAPLIVGLIPAGIGFAYLLYYFIEERAQIASDRTADKR